MDDDVQRLSEEGLLAYARVVQGGNRWLKIVAHVVCRDVNGQVRFEDDAIVTIPIPAGDTIPIFCCEGVDALVVGKGALQHGGSESGVGVGPGGDLPDGAEQVVPRPDQ